MMSIKKYRVSIVVNFMVLEKICGNIFKPNQDKKYKCEVCGKGFINIQSFKDHMNTHTGEKPHLCKYCGAAFASKGTYRRL